MNLNKHQEYFNPENLKKNRYQVHVIGVGAVGSYIALQLVKLGVSELHIWDFDKVDDHNITNQVYTMDDIDKLKVDALEEHLKKSNPELLLYKHGKWNPGDAIEGIVFLEVDSMKVRQDFVDDNEYNSLIHLVVDARIGLESGEVNTCEWQDEASLELYSTKVHSFNDDEANVRVSACGTTLSVSPSVYLSAAMAVSVFINYINQREIKSYIAFNAFDFLMKGANI